MKILVLAALVAGMAVIGFALSSMSPRASSAAPDGHSPKRADKVVHTETEWKKLLTPAAFDVLRNEGTERAFTGKYWDNHQKGTYYCAGCGLPLFSSDTKFESGTGWPSFWKPATKDAVWERTDSSFGETRTEILCSRCDGHLGHVFPDGPSDKTGLRYCMNSVALTFKAAK
jgi:peptide-methionine (R)-S-oxide reductase